MIRTVRGDRLPRMSPDHLLAMYDSQLRGTAEMADAPEVTTIGPLLAATFPARRRAFVTYPPFSMDGPELDHLIETVVARYSADPRVDSIKWKTRDHDPLPHLLDRLRHHGFTVDGSETVLAGDVDAAIVADPGVPPHYSVEQSVTEGAIRQAENLAGRVFQDPPELIRQQGDELIERWHSAPESFEMWAVRDDEGRVVCSGRIDFIDGTDFAGLWGGACDGDHRGRGLYRTLVAQRARRAQARGKRFIQVDCTEYSRPILERAGLTPITSVTAATWHRG